MPDADFFSPLAQWPRTMQLAKRFGTAAWAKEITTGERATLRQNAPRPGDGYSLNTLERECIVLEELAASRRYEADERLGIQEEAIRAG